MTGRHAIDHQPEVVDTGDTLVRVIAGQGTVRLQLADKGPGRDVRAFSSSAISPAQALVLARALAVAAHGRY